MAQRYTIFLKLHYLIYVRVLTRSNQISAYDRLHSFSIMSTVNGLFLVT